MYHVRNPDFVNDTTAEPIHGWRLASAIACLTIAVAILFYSVQ